MLATLDRAWRSQRDFQTATRIRNRERCRGGSGVSSSVGRGDRDCVGANADHRACSRALAQRDWSTVVVGGCVREYARNSCLTIRSCVRARRRGCSNGGYGVIHDFYCLRRLR